MLGTLHQPDKQSHKAKHVSTTQVSPDRLKAPVHRFSRQTFLLTPYIRLIPTGLSKYQL